MSHSKMRSMKAALAIVAALGVAGNTAQAVVLPVPDPGGTVSEIGTRIRWGASGFEASIFDSNPFGQNPTLNPIGSPVWAAGIGLAYAFEVNFSSTTGALDLRIDFNRDGDFLDTQEAATRAVFSGATTSYVGKGFQYLSISGNESGNPGRSNISGLVINGNAQAGMAPGGLFIENFYTDNSGNPLTAVTITGNLTFTVAGTSQERPSWNFNLKNGVDAVPEPGSLTLIAFGAMSLMGGALRRRRRK